jgi:hypothetical protein
LVPYLRHRWTKVIIDNQGPTFGVIDDVCDLLAHQPEIDGVDHKAALGGRQVEFNKLNAVFHQNGNPVALGQAQSHQAMDQLVHPTVCLRVDKRALGIHQTDRLWILTRVELEHFTQIQPMDHGSFLNKRKFD